MDRGSRHGHRERTVWVGTVQVDPLTVAPRPARVASMLAYVVALAGWVTVMGLPKQALTAFGWIWLATIAWNIRAPLRTHLDFLRDWSMPLAVLTIYLYSRGLADDLGFVSVHVTAPIKADRWLFHGTLPTELLQAKLCGDPCERSSTPHWYDDVLTTVYYSHFVVALTIASVLWLRDRSAWVRFMRRYLSLNILALVVYITYPMAPPWLAAQDGFVSGHVTRLTGRGWYDLKDGNFHQKLSAVGNPVAAMPSLHAGIALVRRVVRRCPAAPPMALAAPALSADDVVHARLLRRALRDRHRGGLGRCRPRAVGVCGVGTRPHTCPRVADGGPGPGPEPARSVTGRRFRPLAIAGQKARIVPLQTGMRHGTTLAGRVRRRSHRSATRTEARGGAGTSGGTRPRAVAASRRRRRRRTAVRRPTMPDSQDSRDGYPLWLPMSWCGVSVFWC